MELAKEEANKPFLPKLTPEQQLIHSNDCKLVSQKREKLKGHEGQAFTTIKSLCTERLLYRMKQDPGWDVLLLAADPLELWTWLRRLCAWPAQITMCLLWSTSSTRIFTISSKILRATMPTTTNSTLESRWPRRLAFAGTTRTVWNGSSRTALNL